MNDRRLERLRRRCSVPQFNPSFVPTFRSDNTFHVRAGPHAGPVVEVADVDESGTLADVVEMIDGDHPVEEILGAFDEADHEEICQFLEHLLERNVVTDATVDARTEISEYYGVSPHFDETNRTRLREADVLIVSVGRMGRYVADDLLEVGVGAVRHCRLSADGHASAADDGWAGDTVRPVEASALDRNVAECEYLIYVADRPEPTVLEALNDVAYRSKTPWMVGQVQGFDGFVGPMIFPDLTGCYNCFVDRTRMHVTKPDGYDDYRNAASETLGRRDATLPPFARLIAGYATLDFLNLLSFGEGFSAGRVIHVGALDLAVQVDDVLKVPRCPVCGKEPGEDVSRFVDNLDVTRARAFLEAGDE